ncbi:MAG: hypothetical protein J6D06_09940 [Clostridia bacterium]|nr:hypothetical protein [Clostridia bacterium]
MIKSSDKTKSASVSVSLRQIFTTPIVVCLAIFAVVALFSTFISFSYYEETGTLFSDLNNELKSQDPFYIIYTYYSDVYVGALVGFLLALFQFRFLSEKDACYTRLSFGIKRKALFLNNAFYPLICAVFIVFISRLSSVIVNIIYLGFHVNILKMFVLSTLATVIPIIFSFTVTVIANVITTRKLETILLTASVIALPYAISGLIRNIFSITLFGYGENLYSENEINNLLYNLNSITMLFDYGEFDYFSYGITEKTAFGGEILWCIICIGACIGALLLTASFFEKRFKPENCGKKGVSKLSLTLISFTPSVLLSSVIIEQTNPDYTYTAIKPVTRILLGLAVGSVAAIIINLLVMLGKKKIKQGLLGIGISAGVMGLLIIIGLTGCFGFSTKIPDIEDISSIYVYVPFDDMYENTPNSYFEESYAYTSLDITDKDDFEIIKNIHQSAIKTKGISETSVACDIEYTLKNGDVIRRYYYDVSETTAMESIKLWNTKAVKEYYKVKLNQGKPEEATEDAELLESRDDYYYDNQPLSTVNPLVIASKDLTLTVLSRSSDENPDKTITYEIMLEIMGALYKDICTLSAEEWFMPEEQYGALIFDSASTIHQDGVEFNDVFSELNYTFYVNSNMTNTVNTLKKHGYFQYFECTKEVEKAHIVTADNLTRFIQAIYSFETPATSESIYNEAVKHGIYYTVNNSYREDYLVLGCGYLSDYSGNVMLDYYLDPDYKYDTMVSGGIEEPPQKEITPTEAKNLIKKSFMAYNLGNSGEFLVVKYTDSSCTILALPE